MNGPFRVAVNRRPVHGPWGGGNQWLDQMIRFLKNRGCSVRFDFRRPVEIILMMEPRLEKPATFNFEEIKEYKIKNPNAACIHRINENDLHRGSDSWDKLLAQANQVADWTVFISQWLRDYHAERWFDSAKPHTAILNGADPATFHPVGSQQWRPGQPLRLVTHHWSDNWNKGFRTYQEIDRLLAQQELPGLEFWIIGRRPQEIVFKKAKLFSPQHGAALARLLRRCHVYVTAARWEPGGMHFIEGLACGLPVLYHEEGGGIVEVARPCGVGFRDDIRPAIDQMKESYSILRQAVLSQPPSGPMMCEAYWHVMKQALEKKGAVKTMAGCR